MFRGRRGPYGPRNPYAAKNAAIKRQKLALEAAREPQHAYYEVPRGLFEAVQATGGRWLELVSAADLAGCRVERARKRDMALRRPRPDWAIVYELRAGEIGLLRQGW